MEKVKKMNENEALELGKKIVQRQIDLAKLKAAKGKVSELVNLETEIVDLKRSFNKGLDEISKEAKVIVEGTE